MDILVFCANETYRFFALFCLNSEVLQFIMKKKFGSEVYEYSKDRYKLLIVAPIITAIGSIIFMIIKPDLWYAGLVILGLSVFGIILCLLILRYLNKKIEKEEALKKEKLKELEKEKKEMAEKDKIIKELEEELKQSKNIKQ